MKADSPNNRIRVVHLIGAGLGGAELQLAQLLSEPGSAGVDHRVLLVRDGPLAERFRALVPTEDLGKRRAVDPFFYARLVGALRRLRPDVLHTWTHTPSLWGPSAAALAAVPRTLVAEVGLEDWKGPLLRVADRLNYRLADRVIGCAEAVSAAAVTRGARRESVGTVPLAVHLPANPPPLPGRPDVLLLGRFDPRKGHRDLLHAVPHVLRQLPAARFLLAGPATLPVERATLAQVTAEIRAAGLGANVVISDALPLAAAMARAQVVVVPSTSEGLPNVILEAFAFGRPVVATAVGAISEVVVDGQTGWLVPAHDPSALASALLEAVGNPVEARRRAGRGRALAEQRSFARMLELWQDEYVALVPASAPRATKPTRHSHG